MKEVVLEFDNNTLLSQLVGANNEFLKHIEKKCDVVISQRGNIIGIKGALQKVKKAKSILESLYNHLELGNDITLDEIESFEKLGSHPNTSEIQPAALITPKKKIFPKSVTQGDYIQKMQKSSVVFCAGPAGTGKTFLAVATAVSELKKGTVERIILSRPAVEAGERLGFLPGDIKEKLDPYFRPIYDALYSMIEQETLNRYLENGVIEIAPLAFMRGRTLSKAFVILDEAQNTLPNQMKMFLTRLGPESRMVVTGDPSQDDLIGPGLSGLQDALIRLKKIPNIAFVELTASDIVRHPLVGKIIHAYEKGPLS